MKCRCEVARPGRDCGPGCAGFVARHPFAPGVIERHRRRGLLHGLAARLWKLLDRRRGP